MNDVILVATPTRPIFINIQEWGTELYAFFIIYPGHSQVSLFSFSMFHYHFVY